MTKFSMPMNDANFPCFCRWLGEVWSSRGLDVVCEMLEKPYNWQAEWNEYCWLVENTGDVFPQVTKEEFLENSEISA